MKESAQFQIGFAENRAVRWSAVAAACGLAFWLRCAFGLNVVFQPGGFVNFQDTDAWYHYRVIESLLTHFPWRITFDPYAVFPGGQEPRFGGLYDLGVGAAAWALGGGAPAPELTKAVTAWSPVVLAAFVPAAAYALSRVFFSAGPAIAAAWIVAVLPGNWLKVSRLGFADHHVAEVLFSTLALWALMRSFQAGRRFAVLAGLALGAYLASWATGALIVGVIVVWAGLHSVGVHWRGGSNSDVLERTSIALAVAWVFVAPFAWHRWSIYTHAALAGGILGLLGLRALSGRLERRNAPRWALAVALPVLAAIAVALASLATPERFAAFMVEFQRFQPNARMRTMAELRPLLTYYGPFQLRAVWEQFAFSWLFAIPAMLGLAWAWRRDFRPERSLFLFWTMFMLAMTVSQIRTAYYLAVCFAVLAGFAAWKLLRDSPRPLRYVVAPVLAFLLLWMNQGPALEIVRADSGVSPDMRMALRWLATETSEPFGDASRHLDFYDRDLRSGDYEFPDSAYSVLCWWDLGHQINALAGRIPSSNGFQTGGIESARFFVSTTEQEALAVADRLGARYVVLEPEMPAWSPQASGPTGSKFLAFPLWTEGERDQDEYFGFYGRGMEGGGVESVLVYYPEYYRSMMARMYLFDGRAVEPAGSTWVLAWQDEVSEVGVAYRRITSQRQFSTYEEARRYIEARPEQPLVLGGLDPARSCVPLEALERFRLALNTKPGPLGDETGRVTAVKIFERVD